MIFLDCPYMRVHGPLGKGGDLRGFADEGENRPAGHGELG